MSHNNTKTDTYTYDICNVETRPLLDCKDKIWLGDDYQTRIMKIDNIAPNSYMYIHLRFRAKHSVRKGVYIVRIWEIIKVWGLGMR